MKLRPLAIGTLGALALSIGCSSIDEKALQARLDRLEHQTKTNEQRALGTIAQVSSHEQALHSLRGLEGVKGLAEARRTLHSDLDALRIENARARQALEGRIDDTTRRADVASTRADITLRKVQELAGDPVKKTGMYGMQPRIEENSERIDNYRNRLGDQERGLTRLRDERHRDSERSQRGTILYTTFYQTLEQRAWSSMMHDVRLTGAGEQEASSDHRLDKVGAYQRQTATLDRLYRQILDEWKHPDSFQNRPAWDHFIDSIEHISSERTVDEQLTAAQRAVEHYLTEVRR